MVQNLAQHLVKKIVAKLDVKLGVKRYSNLGANPGAKLGENCTCFNIYYWNKAQIVPIIAPKHGLAPNFPRG